MEYSELLIFSYNMLQYVIVFGPARMKFDRPNSQIRT